MASSKLTALSARGTYVTGDLLYVVPSAGAAEYKGTINNLAAFVAANGITLAGVDGSLTATSGAATYGAAWTITAGNATAAGQVGGNIFLIGGNGLTTGTAGTVELDGGVGASTGSGGPVNLYAGNGGAGGGKVDIAAGAGTSGNASGGDVAVTLGNKSGAGSRGTFYVTSATNYFAVVSALSQVSLGSDQTLGWSSTTNATAAVDTSMTRSSAGVIATGAMTHSGLLTGSLGLTVTGAAVSINASSNFNTSINTGTSNGAITIGNSASGIVTLANKANTAATFLITDGTTSLLALDTRIGVTGVKTFTLAPPASLSFAGAAGNTYSVLSVPAFTLTQTGSTLVTALSGLSLLVGSPTVTDASAETVTTASAVQISGPLPAGSVTFTNSFALDVPTFVTNGTNAAAIRVVAPSGAATNYAIAGASGTALSLGTLAKTATTGASQAGSGLTITADPAVASTDTNGAAAGGSVTITAGAAARLTSGNARGGDVNVVLGAGIGTGAQGALLLTATTAPTSPGISAIGSTTTGIGLPGANNAIDFVAGGVVQTRLQGNVFRLVSGNNFGWSSGDPSSSATDTSLARTAAGVIVTTSWLQNTGGEAALNAAFTSANATLAATNLSFTVIAGRSYRITGCLQVSNTTATEGVQIAFDGGTATATTFFMAARMVGTNVAVNEVSVALATVINYSTVTGTDYILLDGYLKANAGGTLILRAAENTTAAGTMTMGIGSWIALEDTVRV